MECGKCGVVSGHIKKAGFYKNRNGDVQRYWCPNCRKTFSFSNNNGMRIKKEKIHLAIKLLCESSGIRSTSRLTGLHQQTVLKILKISGTFAESLMDEKAKNLRCEIISADEVHSYVGKRERLIKLKSDEIGTQFTFFAVDHKSRFIVNTFTGQRTSENAQKFFKQVKGRVTGRIQLNTDSWSAYRGLGSSIRRVFGDEIDHATEEKTFYKLGQFVSRTLANTKRTRRVGNPNLDLASTSRVERTNLSLRTFSSRFTRCTLKFSKKLINHRLAVDLFVWYQNFARKHASLKTTPAVDIGISVAIMTTVELWNKGL